MEEDIRKNVVPKFISNFVEKCDTLEGFRRFQESVKHLYDSVEKVLPIMQKVEELKLVELVADQNSTFGNADMDVDLNAFSSKSAVEAYKTTLIGTILFDLPSGYSSIVQNFYCVSFKAFCNCNYPAYSEYMRSYSESRVIRI